MDKLIHIHGVRHAYQTASGPLPVLDGLEISVPEGGFVAVVGPSGCGKSTLTKLIAGLMKPDEGEVWLHGERVKSPRATVGMAFQNPVLLEWRTILKNVMLPLEIVPTKLTKKEQEERARYLLALVGLAGFEDKRPSELSGGMRQRASLCRSLVHQPEVLILDEPFGALDAFTREDLWQTIAFYERRTAALLPALRHPSEPPATSIFPTTTNTPPCLHAPRATHACRCPRKTDRGISTISIPPEAAEMLAILRHQIEVAQGRAPADVPAPAAAE